MTPEQAMAEARAGELRPVYLIAGDEPYLERLVLAELKRAALAGGVPGLNDEYLTKRRSSASFRRLARYR